MPGQRHQQIVHGARAVGYRDDQARAILARRLRHGQRVRQADDGEAGAVVGVVLNGVGDDVQAELSGCAFAGEGRPGGVGGGQAGALGIARHRAALGVRQVLGQPGLALGQRLRVGQHGLDAVERIGGAQQVVAHQQAHFAHHMGGGVQEEVERAGDHAFGGVLDAHHAVLRAASGCGVEHFVEVGAVHQVGRTAKELDGGLLAERAFGAQHRHALWRLQRQACGHDFAPDGCYVRSFERSGVGGLNLLDHLGYAVRAKERGALALLDFTHLFGHERPLVQQREQLLVDAVDLHAQAGEVG
ncbi:hypothetical protein D3C71_1285590 [compost metagenome]